MFINKLQLLSGRPIKFHDIGFIHPFTLKDIVDIGGEKIFNSYLSAISINKNIVLGEEEDGKLGDISNLEVVYLLCMQDKNYMNTLLSGMKFILKEDVTLSDYGFHVGDVGKGKIIDKDNFDEFARIIKIQNCIEKQSSVSEDNPASEKARELLEKRRKVREELNRIKNKGDSGDGEPLTLDDLVSILSANGNGINIFNIWDLSFYAFNDQFNRMKMFEDFQINIQSILAGADPEEVEIKHWMSKID